MKIKKGIAIGFILVLALSLTGVVYASSMNAKAEVKRTAAEILEKRKKVEDRLNTVWQDIKKTHKIDESQYVILDTTDKFNMFLAGEMEGFTDKDLIAQMDKIFQKGLVEIPIGSTKPTILIKKNGQEIVFANKDNEGKNILQVFSKKDKTAEFSKEVLSNQGAPIPAYK